MVEVFRTNVSDEERARLLVQVVRYVNDDYRANFDLDDCDRILRIQNLSGAVDTAMVIALLRHFGCDADVLPDTVVSYEVA